MVKVGLTLVLVGGPGFKPNPDVHNTVYFFYLKKGSFCLSDNDFGGSSVGRTMHACVTTMNSGLP